eukprot:1845105-Karenia_brevis.AAC.1
MRTFSTSGPTCRFTCGYLRDPAPVRHIDMLDIHTIERHVTSLVMITCNHSLVFIVLTSVNLSSSCTLGQGSYRTPGQCSYRTPGLCSYRTP